MLSDGQLLICFQCIKGMICILPISLFNIRNVSQHDSMQLLTSTTTECNYYGIILKKQLITAFKEKGT